MLLVGDHHSIRRMLPSAPRLNTQRQGSTASSHRRMEISSRSVADFGGPNCLDERNKTTNDFKTGSPISHLFSIQPKRVQQIFLLLDENKEGISGLHNKLSAQNCKCIEERKEPNTTFKNQWNKDNIEKRHDWSFQLKSFVAIAIFFNTDSLFRPIKWPRTG